MALSVNPLTYIIFVLQADLTLISGTIYSLDTDAFRLELKAWEDDEEGIVQTKTHNHNTEVVIAGVTYARAVDILSPYSIEFEDGQYTVILEGSNNNIFDVVNGILVQNQVQVIPTNSAGLITVVSGSGVTEQDKLDIADRVWDEDQTDHTDADTFGEYLDIPVSTAGGGSITASGIADAVWDEAQSEHTIVDSFGDYLDARVSTISGGGGSSVTLSGIWDYATRELTAGTKDSEIDSILSKVTAIDTAAIAILGLTGENIKWSSLSHDANNNLIGATITLYTDNTLVTPVKSWTLIATYNANSELTAYQMVGN